MLHKFNTLVRLGLVIFLVVPVPVFAYHVTTQAPYNQSLAIDTETGDITIGIQTSDGFEDSPAEKYTIFFDIDNDVTTSSFCVSTSFGHTGSVEWNYHTFSLSDLQTYFENPYGNFRVKIRADNDTDNSFSDLTAQMNIDIPNQLPFVNLVWNGLPQTTCNDTSTTTTTTTTTVAPPPTPNNAISVSVNYQGQDVFFEWEYADNETVDAHSFHINYSYDNTNFTRVIIEDTTLREYTLGYEYIETGTFYWTFSVCGDLENGESCTDSDSNNFETTEYTPPKTTPPTTQAPAPEPDPEPDPAPYVPPTTIPEVVEVVMDDGTVSDYTPAAVADGTVDRDNQRAANDAAYGCYMTDAQIERGDCDIPDTLPIEYPDEDDVIIEVDDDEVDDDEQKPERKTELPSDDDVVPTVVIDIEDTDIEGENKGEPLPPILQIEILDIVDVPIIDLDDIEIPKDIIIVIPDDEDDDEDNNKPEPKVEIEIIEEEEDELDEEVPGDDVEREERTKEEDEGPDPEPEEKTKEQIEEEVEVLEEVIEEVIELPVVEEDITEEVIEEYVEELETEEVVEILEEVATVGVENLESVSEDVLEVVSAVVEEVIEIASEEELTEEQVEVVQEVLQLDEAEDVQIIAEAVKEDEAVAEAVEEYVERAVENADVEDYNLADVVTEVQTEEFLADPVGAFTDIDVAAIDLTTIGDTMTSTQKEKAQEVVVPVIIASQIVASVQVVPVRIRRRI